MQRKCHRCDRLFTQDTVYSAERNFILTNKIEYFVVIGYVKISNDLSNAKKTTRKENKNEDTKHWVWG